MAHRLALTAILLAGCLLCFVRVLSAGARGDPPPPEAGPLVQVRCPAPPPA